MRCCPCHAYSQIIPRILVGLPVSVLLSILMSGVVGLDIGFPRIITILLILWNLGSLVYIRNQFHGSSCTVRVLLALCLLFTACMHMEFLMRRSQPHFGFPPHRVVHVVGTTRFDSTLTEHGNCVLQITLESTGTRFGDTAMATGSLVVVGQSDAMVTAGTICKASGNLVRTETNDWLFISTQLVSDYASSFFERLSSIRIQLLTKVSQRLDTLKGTTATLAKALVLGNSGTDGLSLRQKAIESGCAHILALSGMHLHCIVLLMLFCGNKVLGKRIAQPLAILGAILYVCLIGFKPSLVRAMVLLCLGPLRHRFPILQSLAVTCIVQIVAFPWTIHSTGALLSYCALFSIIVCSTPIAGVLSLFIPTWLSILFATTLSASLGTAPISLVVFGSWHVIGIVLSPLAVPFALLVLFCSLLWLVVPWTPIGFVAVQSTRVFLYLMEWGSEWSANHISGNGISAWVWSITVLLTATGILKYAGQTIRKRNRRAYDLGFSLRFTKRDHRIA